MRARRTNRAQSFWPSIVMKKWLNIKPNVNEFNADKVDTETESEDDAYSLKDAKEDMIGDESQRTQGDEFICPSQDSETPSKGFTSRHRRGKSETLRAQYINTKELRVTIGTWNVAGRAPYADLEIDEWLCTKEPSDIYILGFQELVPLNAGNVLGAEDNRPIPKWETIIRRTLNKSLQPETNYKSYSAPPSPVLRTSSAADVLADELDAPGVEMVCMKTVGTTDVSNFERQDVDKIMNVGKKLKLKRIYSMASDNRVDWPECSLDMTPQMFPTNSKLRNTLSSAGRIGGSGRIGFDWMEKSLIFNTQDISLDDGFRRVHGSSGNLELKSMEYQETSDVLESLSDVSDHFSEEEEDSCFEPEVEKYESGVSTESVKACAEYVRIISKQMVGIYVSVWVRRRLRRYINNLKVFPVGIGLMGYMGNKGSVSISMSLFQTRLCFVCSHLTSGNKEGDEQRRNSDVCEILRRTRFASVLDSDNPQTIPSHDQIFLFGDLNYRLNMLDAEVRKLVAREQWGELINSDQLSKELQAGHVFDGWKEGVIDFPPTYKYEINSDRYVGENPKEGEKKRAPAWCDRILWFGRGIRQLSYKRDEIRLSDHRPVSSVFLVEVEVFNHRKLQRALNFTSAVVHPEVFLDEEEDWEE